MPREVNVPAPLVARASTIFGLAFACSTTAGCFSSGETNISASDTDTDTNANDTLDTTPDTMPDTTEGPGTMPDTDSDPTTGESDTDDVDDDGSTGGETEVPDDDVVAAVIEAHPDFVGFVTELDADSSIHGAEATFEWEILAVPEDSEITTESLAETNSAQTSFLPDLGGNYEIRLTVRESDSVFDTTTQVVTVPTYGIPYLTVAGNQESSTRSAMVIRSDGTGPTPISCTTTSDATSTTSWLGRFKDASVLEMGVAVPRSESDLARITFMPQSADGTLPIIASESTDCDQDPPSQGPAALVHPRFSPSGDRIAALRSTTIIDPESGDELNVLQLVTFDTTGDNLRTIRTLPTPYYFTPPYWVSETRILWVEYTDDASFTHSTVDQENGFDILLERQTHLNCDIEADGVGIITQAAMTPNGLVIGAEFDTGLTDEIQIRILQPNRDGETYDCSFGSSSHRVLANIGDPSGFAVSPDGSELLFIASPQAESEEEEETFGIDATRLYRMSLDSAESEPVLVFGGDNQSENFGPKWAIDGRQFFWTSVTWENFELDESNSFNRPAATSIMVMNADGSGDIRTLQTSSSTMTLTRTLTTGDNDIVRCAVSTGGRGPATLFLALLALGVRRRRRSS